MNLIEGQTGIAVAEDLIYPNINSCLSITIVLNDGTRVGGHAVLIPEDGQQNLNNILTFIANNSPIAQRVRLYIIGDIGTWDDNLDNIRNIHGIPNGVNNIVNYIQQRLPVGNNTERDTDGSTYDVQFNQNHTLVLIGHNGAANINLPNW